MFLPIILPRGKLWEIRRLRKRPVERKTKAKQPVLKTPRIANKFISNFDVQGSYTGVNAEDVYEKPIQDADDL